MGIGFKMYKNSWEDNTPYGSSSLIKVPGSPENPDWFEKITIFKLEILTVAANLKVLKG